MKLFKIIPALVLVCLNIQFAFAQEISKEDRKQIKTQEEEIQANEDMLVSGVRGLSRIKNRLEKDKSKKRISQAEVERKEKIIRNVESRLSSLENKITKQKQTKSESVTLSGSQTKIVRAILQSPSARVLVNGWAGTGKSVVVREIVKILGEDSVCLTATTGISALHIKGRTVHSALNVPFAVDGLNAQTYLRGKPKWLVTWLQKKYQKIELIEKRLLLCYL